MTRTPHAPYIEAVAAALAESGTPVTAAVGESLRGFDATLDIDVGLTLPAYGADDVILRWSEIDGWLILWDAAPRSHESLAALCDSLIPAPSTVVAAVRAALVERPQAAESERLFRRLGENTDRLLAMLDVYADRPGYREEWRP